MRISISFNSSASMKMLVGPRMLGMGVLVGVFGVTGEGTVGVPPVWLTV